ncbi:MAG: type VI secretion system tip protein VgrG [Zoogloea sp.]|nr:type VI secretion system tip protein VgrG [Zoogloea sp.]
MDVSSLAELAASGAALFNQHARLIRLRFGEGCPIAADALLPQRVRGEEGLSRNYRYELDCLSPDMHVELKDLLGQPVEIGLLLPEGGERLLTGLVTRAEQRGADGGFALYRLTVEPALATLAHRRNSRVFSDKTVPEIVSTLLDEHLAANTAFTQSFQYEAHLEKSYPQRSYTLQYRESDLAFIERLLAEEGISYCYTHGPEAGTSLREALAEEEATPLHTLVLFDANHQLPGEEPADILFHRTDGVEREDAIDRWHGARAIGSGKTTLASYDYKAVSTHIGDDGTRTRHGEAQDLVDHLEDYDPQTGYYGSDPDDMVRYAELRQQAKDLATKTFQGAGTVRSLTPGTSFRFLEHPIHDQDAPEDREFLVTGLSFEAENNLLPEAKASLGGLLDANSDGAGQNRPPYRNSFTAVRRHVPVVPDYHQSPHHKPTAHGLTTATVVGPAGEEIFTDEHGRIKIQFHWQRPQDHPEGGADFDDRSSTWVRVAMPSAGAQWGTQYIPRIGQEVVIDFIEGDIDRPLVTGVVYNGTHRPPTFSGAGQLPANKTLSGVKSKEYKGSRYNELLFDDTTGELRTKLSSEHAKTQVNQGFLIHPRTNGKGRPRGEGLEARTDAYAALRGARGILIAADARETAANDHLDSKELSSQLATSLELSKNLSEASVQHQAAALEANPTAEHLLAVSKATYQQAGTEVAGYSEPILALSAPAGIVAATPKSQQLAAGQHLHLSSQSDTNLAVGNRLVMAIKEAWSVFVATAGIKLFAGKGKVEVQAQDDAIEATAQKDFLISSVQGHVVITGKESVTLYAGGAMIRLQGGNIDFHCPGKQTFKAATRSFEGPASASNPLPVLPKGPLELPGDEFPFSNH